MSIDQISSRDRAKLDLELLESSLRATVPWNRDSCCGQDGGDSAVAVVTLLWKWGHGGGCCHGQGGGDGAAAAVTLL